MVRKEGIITHIFWLWRHGGALSHTFLPMVFSSVRQQVSKWQGMRRLGDCLTRLGLADSEARRVTPGSCFL